MKVAEIKNCLLKMGYNAVVSKDYLNVDVPAWRADILHEIDLIEDVAIGYGYSKFESEFPKALTFGKKLPKNNFYNALRNAMIGLGFNEVTTFTISNENDEFKKMGLKHGKIIQFENPIGEEFSTLRVGLIPSLLKILGENRHHSLPQQIFELGIVVDEDFKNNHHLGFVKIDAKSSFTECKSFVEAITREAGVNFKIKDYDHSGFVKGRCASIMVKSKEIGFFGEIHPKTIAEFQLEHPVIAFEAQIDGLYQ
jgi:phenylalanyl-tRNA synthetase beta chain